MRLCSNESYNMRWYRSFTLSLLILITTIYVFEIFISLNTYHYYLRFNPSESVQSEELICKCSDAPKNRVILVAQKRKRLP